MQKWEFTFPSFFVGMTSKPQNNLDLSWWNNSQTRMINLTHGFSFGIAPIVSTQKSFEFPTTEQIRTVLKQPTTTFKGKNQNIDSLNNTTALQPTTIYNGRNLNTNSLNNSATLQPSNDIPQKRIALNPFSFVSQVSRSNDATTLATESKCYEKKNLVSMSKSDSDQGECTISLCEDDDWDDVVANMDLQQIDSYQSPPLSETKANLIDNQYTTSSNVSLSDLGDQDLEALKQKLESEIARRQSTNSTQPSPNPYLSRLETSTCNTTDDKKETRQKAEEQHSFMDEDFPLPDYDIMDITNETDDTNGIVFDLVDDSDHEDYDSNMRTYSNFDNSDSGNNDQKLIRITTSPRTATSQWGGRFPWSKKLVYELRETFGLYEFREQQLEVINCTMSGKDVFVLMPTGGGKSLCYQLPAVISSGLTIVVSPLVSLIQDQVMQLDNLGIEANFLGAGQSESVEREIYSNLRDPHGNLKILYITPEKLCRSNKLQNALVRLHEQGRTISRVAIDEAHCVSQWGRDFRPDYRECKLFKELFPSVPVIALTATATDTVRTDAIMQLGLTNVEQFKTSFNRPNLRYEVRKKKGKASFTEMCQWIKFTYGNRNGIIYCLSRKECEVVAGQLEENNISANFYHAELQPEEREARQRDWNRGVFNVMVATIAFGMGINKSNVRFVIHYTIPKSIEGYYQESGRAGRDGLVAHSIVYYSYSDTKRIERLLESSLDGDSSYDRRSQLAQNKKNLFAMVNYCENIEECRRVQLMHYLGETFLSSQCNKTCDICCNPCSVEQRDMTANARSVLNLVKSMGGRHTILQIITVWQGSKTAAIKKSGFDKLIEHGAGKNLTKNDAERLIQNLVRTGQLVEDVVFNKFRGTSIIYIKSSNKPLPTPYFMNFRQKIAISTLSKTTSPRKEELTSLLVKELKKVQKEHVKKGIDTNVCNALIELMAVELPTSPQDLITEKFTKICDKTIILRYCKKFTEAINKFLQEHPEITGVAPLNTKTLDHHFGFQKKAFPTSTAQNTHSKIVTRRRTNPTTQYSSENAQSRHRPPTNSHFPSRSTKQINSKQRSSFIRAVKPTRSKPSVSKNSSFSAAISKAKFKR